MVFAKLAAIRMGIRTGADSQKSVAIDAGMDQAQLSRKLHHLEPFTFDDFAKLPEDVQRIALLEMLTQLGLPEQIRRSLPIARVVEARRKKIA